MGHYDLPAAFKYVMEFTGQSKFSYIGHSMGTSEMMVALADNPDFYRPILNLIVFLGPVYTLHEAGN
jgi:pimeloyl-ACP methyl ester carboxylesterase